MEVTDHDPLLEKNNGEKIPIKTKLIYGVGEFSYFSIAIVQGFFLLDFLLEVAQIDGYWAGTILLISQLWDGIIDPFIGRWTDMTRSRWGKRRPFLIFGALPLGITFWLLWQVPPFLSKSGLIVYYLLALMALNFVHVMVTVPYSALTPELSSDYNERTSLTTIRFIFGFIGGLVGSYLMASLSEVFLDEKANEKVQESQKKKGFLIGSLVLGVMLVLSSLITGLFLKEKPKVAEEARITWRRLLPDFFSGIRHSFKNKAFMMVTLMFLLSWMVICFIQNNLFLYVKYVLNAEKHTPYFLLVIQTTSAISLYFLQLLSTRFGKKKTFFFGVSFLIADAIVITFIQEGMLVLSYVCCFFAGIGVSAALLVGWSMLPDAIDYDELKTGMRREGDLYGIFLLVQKLALGLALALSSYALAFAGYVAPDNDESTNNKQPDSVVLALRLMTGAIPGIVMCFSFIPLYFYPITKEKHQEILEELAQRKKQSEFIE